MAYLFEKICSSRQRAFFNICVWQNDRLLEKNLKMGFNVTTESTWPRAKMWKYANFRRVSFYNLCIQAFSYAFVAEGQAWNILFSSTASYVSEIVFMLIFIQFIITVWCFRLILHVGSYY